MSEAAARPGMAGALCEALAFAPAGAATGNLTVGRGTVGGATVEVALLENRVASGSVGRGEAATLAALFRRVASERLPLVLFIDSAGARISEGLAALGSFRDLFRAALDAARSGAPIAAVLGRNCYGGSSMLAHVAPRRLFAPTTQLAMSGPSIIASAAGTDALDEMFRAMAEAAMSPAARAKASDANTVWEEGGDMTAWLASALVPHADPPREWQALHAALGARLEKATKPRAPSAIFRNDLAKLFPEGYEAQEFEGLVTGSVVREGRREPMVAILARTPVGCDRAWHFAHAVWDLVDDPAPARLNVVLDCESHAARLEDERFVLSEYIVGMSYALAAFAAGGRPVELTILGRAGGGVYVALAAPATHVAVEYGAQVQVLPGAAVAAILGEDRGAAPPAAESVAAGVADREIRLGLVTG